MNTLRNKFRSLACTLVLAAAVSLAGCGSDDEQTQGVGGGVGSPGVINNAGIVNPAGVGGVSNCTTQFGQPGIFTNGICMPNVNGNYCNQPVYNGMGGVSGQTMMMCPCPSQATTGVIVTPPGGGSFGGGSSFCGGNQYQFINGQYYYYVTPNGMYPSYYPQQTYHRYYWSGSAWIYI